MSKGGGAASDVLAGKRGLLGAAASLALLLAAGLLLLLGGDGGSGSDLPSGPRLVEAGELEEAAGSLGHPLYWVGPRGNANLELKLEADGSAFLRYLPAEAEAGDPRVTFLTVGTYPVADAQAALRRAAAEGGVRLRRLEDGSVVLPNPGSAGSVYLAYPDSDLEIEVYDPRPGRALRLIRSGAVVPVGG